MNKQPNTARRKELPKAAVVEEGQMDAILRLLHGSGGSVAADRFPGWHTVLCMKHGKTTDEPDSAFFKGKGYKMLSDKPEDSGHADMCVMGVPEEVWQHYMAAHSKLTNDWRTTDSETGDRIEKVEVSGAQSLDSLSNWADQK